MQSLNACFEEYKKQLKIGNISTAYKSLIEYMMKLRTYFKNNYPDYIVGSFYQGYMDVTFFPITTKLLKKRKLKFTIVFDHQKIQFEIWLTAQNQQIRNKYSELITEKEFGENYISTSNPYSIIEYLVIENPNFDNLDKITNEIEEGVKTFLRDVASTLDN